MSCARFKKDPNDKRIINIDFSDFMGSGVSIASVVWTIPTGLTESNSSETATVATNYLSGGTLHREYQCKCTITTDDSPTRIKSQSFLVEIAGDCD